MAGFDLQVENVSCDQRCVFFARFVVCDFATMNVEAIAVD